MPLSQATYHMVYKVHNKLVQQAASPYLPLRNLVLQANTLDRLYVDYYRQVKQEVVEEDVVELLLSEDDCDDGDLLLALLEDNDEDDWYYSD